MVPLMLFASSLLVTLLAVGLSLGLTRRRINEATALNQQISQQQGIGFGLGFEDGSLSFSGPSADRENAYTLSAAPRAFVASMMIPLSLMAALVFCYSSRSDTASLSWAVLLSALGLLLLSCFMTVFQPSLPLLKRLWHLVHKFLPVLFVAGLMPSLPVLDSSEFTGSLISFVSDNDWVSRIFLAAVMLVAICFFMLADERYGAGTALMTGFGFGLVILFAGGALTLLFYSQLFPGHLDAVYTAALIHPELILSALALFGVGLGGLYWTRGASLASRGRSLALSPSGRLAIGILLSWLLLHSAFIYGAVPLLVVVIFDLFYFGLRPLLQRPVLHAATTTETNRATKPAHAATILPQEGDKKAALGVAQFLALHGVFAVLSVAALFYPLYALSFAGLLALLLVIPFKGRSLVG